MSKRSGYEDRIGSLLASLLAGFFIITICVGPVSAQTTTPPRSGTQIWIESLFATPITERVDLVILGGLHFGRKAERPVVEHTSMGIGASFRLNKHLTIFPFYTHFENQTALPRRNNEERFTLEATLKFPLRHFTLSDRNRLEYHLRTPPPSFIHYRNRIQLERSLKHGLTPFLADEVYYDSHFGAWIRNRVYAGISKKVSAHFTFDIYYLRQSDSHSHPGDLNVVGSTLKFRL